MAAPIATRLILNAKSFTQGMSKATKAVRVLGGALGKVGGIIAKLGLAFTAFAGVIAAVIVRQTAFLARLQDTSDKLGIGVQFLQKFRYAAEQSGVSIETADMALQRFTRRIAEASQGMGEARGALAQLGIKTTDATGRLRPMEEILFDVADGIKNTTDEAERVRLAFKFFDSEGVALVNTLNEGGDALKAMFDRAKALGIVLEEDVVRGAKAFDNALTDLNKIIGGIATRLTAELAPVLEDITMKFIEFIQSIVKQQGGWENFGKFLKDEFLKILSTITVAFMKLYNVIVNVLNGIQTGLAKLGLIDDVNAIRDTINELREDSQKGFFDRKMFKVLIGAHQELRDEFGNFEYFSEEDYNKAIQILEAKAKRLEQEGVGISLIKPFSQEDMNKVMEFFTSYTEAAKQANQTVIEEVTVTGKAMGFTFAKLMDQIFGVDRMTKFWNTFDDEASNAADKIGAVATLLFDSFADFVKGIADKIEAAGIGDYMKTLEDGFISAVQKFEDSLTDAILTGKADFSDLAQHIKQVFAKALVQKFITGPIMGLFGLASGGPANAGQPYIVGEKGPELFIPKQSGTVIPNDETMDIMGAGGPGMGSRGTTVNYNINAVDARSFKQLVASDPEFIFNVSQAGARRLPG